MAITAKYVLVCDDFRQEVNGKFIVIGLYTPDMVVQQIPFLMPTLTFFMCLESDRPGNFTFRFKLEHLETGRPVAEAMGAMQFVAPGIATCPVKMGNVQLSGQGAYQFSLIVDGQKDPIMASFSVILQVPGQTQGQPPAGYPHL